MLVTIGHNGLTSDTPPPHTHTHTTPHTHTSWHVVTKSQNSTTQIESETILTEVWFLSHPVVPHVKKSKVPSVHALSIGRQFFFIMCFDLCVLRRRTVCQPVSQLTSLRIITHILVHTQSRVTKHHTHRNPSYPHTPPPTHTRSCALDTTSEQRFPANGVWAAAERKHRVRAGGVRKR
jgi:hypothetical protein